MLGIARHHQKQPVQQAYVIYFTSAPQTFNTGTYGYIEYGLPSFSGGIGNVERLISYYGPYTLTGIRLPAGTWVIDFSYYASAYNYETNSPLTPPDGMNNFIIRRGDPITPPNNGYYPIWGAGTSVVWTSNAGDGGVAEWEAYNNGTYMWRTKQPLLVENSFTNSPSTQPIVLTEATNFWITLNMLGGTKYYSMTSAIVTVNKLD